MIKLGETVYFDVTTRGAAGVVDADSLPTFTIWENDSLIDVFTANMVKRTGSDGNYVGSFVASLVNGFEVGKWYNVVATGTVDGVTDKTVVLTFVVRQYSFDDIILAIIASGVTSQTNFNDESEELNLKRTDDYTDNTDQEITFIATGFIEFPSNSVYFRASRNGTLIFDQVLCETAVLSPTTQSVTVQLTRDQIVLLNYGAVDDYRFRCTYVADSNPDPDIDDGEYRTIRWGKINVERVGA